MGFLAGFWQKRMDPPIAVCRKRSELRGSLESLREICSSLCVRCVAKELLLKSLLVVVLSYVLTRVAVMAGTVKNG